MTLVSAAVLLFFVMDPLGNVLLFLSALKHVDPARSRFIIVREMLIALAIMIVFLFVGRYVLDLLHVSRAALTAGGGFILLLIALRMIFPTSERSLREEVEGEPFVVPLAVPYTAGPSMLATELLFMSREPERWPVWLGAVVLAWCASAIILYFASNLGKLLGEHGLTAVERLMGMLLVIVGVEMLMAGAAEYLRT
ncbi:MAG TPA: MarC family protein [Gemmatimonadales bacterium]|jgi:multiple antibiotic resistance protein|nr:MarC family protein [Gemmatimonadales bacterium]